MHSEVYLLCSIMLPGTHYAFPATACLLCQKHMQHIVSLTVDRQRVEHGSFTPLVFTTGGGMGQEVTVVIRKLANDLAMKRNESYSRVVSWMRCCLAFSLARSAIRCVRGSRSIRRTTHRQAPVDLVQAETLMEQV